MPQYNNLQEEELKLRIAEAFFAPFDCNTRIGRIDFCVTQKQDTKHVIAGEACLAPTEGRETVSLLWAEAHSHHWQSAHLRDLSPTSLPRSLRCREDRIYSIQRHSTLFLAQRLQLEHYSF